MAQATSGEKEITIEGQKYRLRTQVVYQNGLGVTGTLSTTAPIRYVVQYKPLPSPLNPVPDWSNLGERDTNDTNNWIFTPIAGGGFKKALSAKGSNSLTTSLDDATSNALSKSAKVTKQQANLILQVAPNVAPTVPAPQPTPTPASGTTQQTPTSDPTITTKDLPEQIKGIGRKWNNETYYYPTSIQTNGQDFIKFNIIQYQASKINEKNSTSIQEKNYTTTTSLATIILPIQPSITDRNIVEWQNNSLSPVDLALYSLSSTAMTGDINDINSILSKLGDTVTKDENVKKAITLYLKQKALNVEGLLSRFGGAIVNPNLELLFQGPQLRPFDFTFRLSPRDKDEATEVRKIIRAFKEAMAPQVSNGNLFLAAPNVFNISYHTKGKDNEETLHPSLNKIKTCALQSCNVDYTPDGSYMTFNDEKRTMTSYNLTLQFVELEPVTSKDYAEPYDEIGY